MVLHDVVDLDDYYKYLFNKEYSNSLIVCYFTATWCGPCRMISPELVKLGTKSENIVVLKIDVDDCEEVASQCGIDCMPTFRLHLNNEPEPVKKLMGADKNSLYNMIGELMIQINNSSSQESLQTSNSNNNSQGSNSGSGLRINTPKKNTDMDVPFMYNPIPEHNFRNN